MFGLFFEISKAYSCERGELGSNFSPKLKTIINIHAFVSVCGDLKIKKIY